MTTSPLTLIALLTGCYDNDEEVLKEPESPALEIEEEPVSSEDREAEEVRQAFEDFRTRSEYIDGIVCSRGGEGLFGSTKVHELYQLYGTVSYHKEDGTLIAYEAMIKRRGSDETYPETSKWLDDPVGEYWQIIEISRLRVIVLNQCGYEEILLPDSGGAIVHETRGGVECGRIEYTKEVQENCMLEGGAAGTSTWTYKCWSDSEWDATQKKCVANGKNEYCDANAVSTSDCVAVDGE